MSSSTNSRKAKRTAAARLQILSSDILGYKEKKRPRRVVDMDRQKAPSMQSRPQSGKITQGFSKVVTLKSDLRQRLLSCPNASIDAQPSSSPRR